MAEETPPRSDELSKRVGWRQPAHTPFMSKESCDKSDAFKPQPSDVFVATPCKVGTTVLTMLCHSLRTRGLHLDFEDIYQVVPWDQLAWDLDQNLDDEQVAQPRVFKSHLPLSSVARGAKYITAIREPCAVMESFWRFINDKKSPILEKYKTINEFIYDKDCVVDNMVFGVSLWGYYVEYVKCLDMPEVMVICYEDFVADPASHVPEVAKFMGLPPLDAETTALVLKQISKEFMIEHISKFDETWAFEQAKSVGRMPYGALGLTPAARVHNQAPAEGLNDTSKAFLQQRWKEVVEAQTGLPDYAALIAKVRESRRA